MTDVATLGLRVDATGAISELSKFDRALDSTAKKSGELSKSIATGLGVAVIGGSLAALRKMYQETGEAQQVMAQLEAVIKSTGSAAGYSVKQLDEMSVALQRQTTFSDEAVKSAETLLLSFKNIRGPEFQGAITAVTDMSARLGTDLSSSAIKVGRALDDPIRGMRALQAAGVTFSGAQRDVIKQLVETGQVVEAQKIILDRLTESYGGAAKAAKETLPGALAGLKNAYGDLFEETEQNTKANVRFINTLTRILEKVKEIREANVNRLNPKDPLDFFRNEKDPGATGRFYSGGTTTITAKALTDRERQAIEDARTKAEQAAKRAAEEWKRVWDGIADLALKLKYTETVTNKDIVSGLINAPSGSYRDPYERAHAGASGRSRLQEAADKQAADAILKTTKHFGDLGDAAKRTAQTLSQAAEYLIVSKVGGGGIAGSLGAAGAKGAFQNAASSGAFGSSFASTAAGAAIFNPLVAGAGAILGQGFGAFVSDVFGSDTAKREARESFQKAIDDFSRSIASVRARISGNSLEADIIDVQQEFEDRRQRAKELYRVGGVFGNKDIEAAQRKQQEDALREINELEAQRIAQLKEERAVQNQQFKEDLQVRALRASGRDREADILAKRQADQREYDQAVKDGADAATLAFLKTVQAAEEVKQKMDSLTTSAKNAPRGFKVESYINRYATPLGSGAGGTGWTPPPLNIPYSPTGPNKTGNTYVFQIGENAFQINGDETPKEIADKTIKGLREFAALTIGPNTSLSQAMDYWN